MQMHATQMTLKTAIPATVSTTDIEPSMNEAVTRVTRLNARVQVFIDDTMVGAPGLEPRDSLTQKGILPVKLAPWVTEYVTRVDVCWISSNS